MFFLKKYSEAIKQFEKAIEKEGEAPETLFYMGFSLKEIGYFKNFPDGIASDDNISDKQIKFIHIDIEFTSQIKEVEIFDINSPQKEGYKVIKFQDSKYF